MTDELLALVGPDLSDDVARCAAAAGYQMLRADPEHCRREWLRADAVVADVNATRVLAELGPPRRAGLVMVTDGEPAADIWRSAMSLGADRAVSLPAEESTLVGLLTELRSPLAAPAGAVAVIGGHGGAGATTLAAAVALTAAEESTHVLLFDVDEFGAGIDLTLGIEGRAGLRWQDLTLAGGAVRAQSLHSALPQVNDRLSVLAPRRDSRLRIGVDAVIATMDAGRVNGDTVVVDLPRTADPVTDAVLDSVDLVVLVTTAGVHGVASSRTVAARLGERGIAAALAVRGPAPSGLRASEVASAVGLPLLTAYRSDPGLPGRMEAGRLRVPPRSPLGRAALAVYRKAGAAERLAA
ncbi:septum site-determining protein Ssd [Gordonia hankookensis]|uniref:Rv3660c-like CheY-like N-terminal domain-containing protein n=1 Tax=Gordonia hankookensis TaxID=589403 RepID=A0ABR7WKV4_9ACTN|nr:septum site-determining protein Ssd [Gordonia hankookensis]MBD1322362.1 hypothetical protein [Gordonia hankookensis]